MKKTKLIVPALIIFLSGVLVGGLGGLRLYHHMVVNSIEAGPSGIRELFMKKLVRDLDLTDHQQEQVDRIILEAQERFRALRVDYQPQVETIIRDALNEIATVLEPDQQEKLKGIEQKIMQRWSQPV